MSSKSAPHDSLRREIGQMTELVRRAAPSAAGGGTETALPLRSLIAQLQAVRQVEPIRLFKHFACTGGTIMSKCLAAMPNTVLLSEMDPLSLNYMSSPSKFAPSDLIKQMRYSRHDLSDALAIDIFCAGLGTLQEALTDQGKRLVLREHSHSQYCTAADWTARQTVEQIVARDHPVLPLLSVRHPLASFMSLRHNGWDAFTPGTLEEYARRYLAFLDANATCPIVYYEDFVEAPETVLENMCRSLELSYDAAAPSLVMAITMSGDSGRSGNEIAARPSRTVPPDLAEAADTGPTYRELCRRLRYPLLPDAAPVALDGA
ncbi:hypothetical protein JYP51_19975 [Ponticoccus gilvus]|nr:hypothetical protein [Enemella evansiae]